MNLIIYTGLKKITMQEPGLQNEVINTLENSITPLLEQYLKPVEENWQPADFLPDSRSESFAKEVRDIQEIAQSMSYDLLVSLIGDTITEEALPNYETWLMSIKGISASSGLSKWVRGWTAEENRHGDLLNRYLYLSGRVDMKQFEISTQYLISDGFDTQAGNDPYQSFIFTSFQELATNISHRRVASQVKKLGDDRLGKICGVIAADEARHANAYKDFINIMLEMDPSGILLAFQEIMKKKIVMPAHNLRGLGDAPGKLFDEFSYAAQRTNVYTTQDYIKILQSLLNEWRIGDLLDLSPDAKRAQDYLMLLPKRLERISSRMKIPQMKFSFKWVSKSNKF